MTLSNKQLAEALKILSTNAGKKQAKKLGFEVAAKAVKPAKPVKSIKSVKPIPHSGLIKPTIPKKARVTPGMLTGETRKATIEYLIRSGKTANEIVKTVKGRKTNVLKEIRAIDKEVEKKFIRDVKKATGFKPETKKTIIEEYKKLRSRKNKIKSRNFAHGYYDDSGAPIYQPTN